MLCEAHTAASEQPYYAQMEKHVRETRNTRTGVGEIWSLTLPMEKVAPRHRGMTSPFATLSTTSWLSTEPGFS